MRKLLPFLVLLLIAGLTSCNETLAPTDTSCAASGLYPLAIGNFISYEVTEIQHSELGEDDTINYQLKEVLADTLTDLSAQQAYRIERFRRTNESQNWSLDSIWTVRNEGVRIVKVESNVPYVKLICPLEEELSWNGNAFNGLMEERYVVQDLQEPFQLDSELFDNTVKVVQHADTSSLLSRDYRIEIFAQNIGLIYKKKEVFRFCDNADDPCFGQDSVIGGTFYEQKLLDFGQE